MKLDCEVIIDGLRIVLAPGSEINGRQSSIKNYLDCHRLYGWERIENLAPEQKSFALEFGSATHVFLLERKRGTPLALAKQKGIERLLRDFPKDLFPGDEEEMYNHKQLAENLWPEYEKHWEAERDVVIPLGQEVKGRVEVGNNTNVFLVFAIDQLMNFAGQLWIGDYKTMGKNDDRNFRSFEVDIQPTAYVYGATKVLRTRIAGVMIDGLIKTKTPQFRREQYIRTDAELLEFEEEFVEIMRELAWRHARVAKGENWKTVFYKNTRKCFNMYKCPFLELCAHDSPIQRMAYVDRTPDYMDDPTLLSVNPHTGEIDEPNRD